MTPQGPSTPWLRTALLFACALAMLSSLPPAHATNIGRAVTAYKQGYNLYYQKKYRLALQYFLLSSQSLPEQKRYANTRNALNFFIGDCHFRLNQNKEAFVRLQAYVGAIPKARQKGSKQYAKAQAMLRTLRKRMGLPPPRRIQIRRPPPERRGGGNITRVRVPPKPKPVAKRPHPMGWVLAGLGVVALAGAVITGITAQGSMQDAFDKREAMAGTAQPFANAVSNRANDAFAQSTIANVLYIGGGTLTGVGVIMLIAWRVPAK